MKHNSYKKWLLSAFSFVLAACSLAACGKEAASSQSTASISAPPPASSSSAPAPKARRQIDFKPLQAQNEDVIAWIEVPGTVIDYPIVYSSDNSFYLDHDEKKEYSKYGAIFVDMSNPVDFSYPVMVAYGHYTPDETHFTQLHKYEDPDYFAENRELYVYLPNAQRSYEIVAALLIGQENILYEKDYTDKETMQSFLTWIEDTEDPKANINLEGAGPEDEYLVLSTCTQSEYWSDQRYVVIAKLTETLYT